MRPIERIPLFLDKINLKVLDKKWGTNLKDNLNIDKVKKVWLENPDWRFSQVLINMDIIPNTEGMWYYTEDDTLLMQQGVLPRDVLFWGNTLDKEGNELPKRINILIKDMSTPHIEALLSGEWRIDNLYRKTFEQELTLRELNEEV